MNAFYGELLPEILLHNSIFRLIIKSLSRGYHLKMLVFI